MIPNRAQRRADNARRRLVAKRSEKVVALSTRLAHQAALGWSRELGFYSRNAARRHLKAEVTRRYGSVQAKLMDARLVPARDVGA